MATQVGNTIALLQECQRDRKLGRPVAYSNDPAWLVQQAINRRGGYLDDPSWLGSCIPVNGRYPQRAERDCIESRRLAHQINGRLVVRLRDIPLRYRDRLIRQCPERISDWNESWIGSGMWHERIL